MDTRSEKYDVIICGGGLAGQTLARQINRKMPDCSILLVDRQARPLPVAALKVGESSVETGANYLGAQLGLAEYFETQHLFKCGLRYFFGDSHGPVEDRAEFGLSKFPEVHSYQIDRGVLENDLREMNAEAGIELMEGVQVRDILISDGDELHEVILERDGEKSSVHGRWVVDATGRRQILQRKLKLRRNREKNCSSAWFRYEGRVDVCDLVPAENKQWHDRVPDRNRYYSTTHLMGDGYWVWLIPLGSGNTSVGIVTDEQIHPFSSYRSYELSLKWLEEHEPVLHEYLRDRKPMDFLGLRKYSHTSSQIFSHNRWACVGEAGVFADPFYSPGSDLIGFANTLTTEMIWLESQGQLTQDTVSEYNNFVIGLNNALTVNIQQGYPFFGKGIVSAAKLIWDNTAAWSFVTPQMFNSTYVDLEKQKEIRRVTASFFGLTRKVQLLLIAWAKHSPGRLTFDFLDYLSIPYLHSLRRRNLRSGKPLAELIEDQERNMQCVEELAQVLFMLAVEDVLPEHLDKVQRAGWLNPWRISLDPERWEADGLFEPRSLPRSLDEMYSQVRGLFRIDSQRESQPSRVESESEFA